MKAVEVLGEAGLMRPVRVANALHANDQAKTLLSVLQAARNYADNPHQPVPHFGQQAAGLGEFDIEDIIEQTRQADRGRYRVPELDRLRQRLLACVEEMLAPLPANEGKPGDPTLHARFAALAEQLRLQDRETITADEIDQIAAADRKRRDSLHLVVMDAHKALNRMQLDLAESTIDGALVYGLAPGDDALVRAFMGGLNRTAPLKFEHPGLGTTAMRSGDRLTIQNDIGTTDAHVLVIHVDPDAIELTYTDVHLPRLKFFRSLFPKTIAQWNDAEMRESKELADGDTFYMSVAVFPGAAQEVRARNLALIGSRLVFLIDWNKARKRLSHFLKNDESVALLKWAADEDIGHRGFLQLGGERLIYDAIEAASAGQVRYGDTLTDIFGTKHAVDFLKFVLRSASRGLRIGRSPSLIADQIRAELLSRFRSQEQRLLDLVTDHAGYTLEIADAVRSAIANLETGGERDSTVLSHRAKSWERAADEKVIAVRRQAQGKPEAAVVRRVIEFADDATDDLEEAAHLLSLFPATCQDAKYYTPLQQLGGQVVDAAREWTKVLANAVEIRRNADREEADDLLVAVDRLERLERETDRTLRRVQATLIAESPPLPQFHLVIEIARCLEHATDALMRAALMIHDHVLSDVLRR
jgi:uncharacterized protein Yka (UPF0111/DUF47 family)